MLLLSTAFWAFSFPAMRALALVQQGLLPDADSWFLTSLGVMYRFGAAGLVLALFSLRVIAATTRLEIEQGILLAAFGSGGILFQMDGLTYTNASTSAFLTQGYSVLIPLWVALTTRRRPSGKVLFCVTLVVAGVAVLAGLNLNDFKPGRGEAETLLSSVLFAGQILALEHPRYTANRSANFSVVMFFAMSLFASPVVCITMPDVAACMSAYASVAALCLLAGLVLVCTLGGYLLMNRWQRGVSATEAGLIYSVEPVFASLLALFLPAWISGWAGIHYPNEQLTTRLLIGGVLITAANIILRRR